MMVQSVLKQHNTAPSVQDDQSSQHLALDLIEDSVRAQKWIQNANMAIDIARASLEEASKLASGVQLTTQETVGKAVERGDIDLGRMKDEAERKTEQVVDLAGREEGIGLQPTPVPVKDMAELHECAVQVQASVAESRQALLEAKTQPVAQSMTTTTDLRDQVIDLAVLIEDMLHPPAVPPGKNEPGSVEAENILKGEFVTVDGDSLNKIDGLPRKNQAAESLEDQPLNAEHVLKLGDKILTADPVSLDKIDGLPDREHKGVEGNFTTILIE